MSGMLIGVRDIRKRYGDFEALRGVSFDIGKTEIVAIVGPNGAGKTTLVNSICGHGFASGDVVFEGHSIEASSPAALARRGLMRSFQLVAVFPTLSVRDMISVGVFSAIGRTFNGLRRSEGFEKQAADIEAIAQAFGLQDRLSTPCAALSQGEKKLVDIASALTLRPRLIFLDEPTSGISSADKYRVMDRILEAAPRCGVQSLVLIEHDMELIARYATRVIGLRTGKVVADMPPADFFADREMIDTIVGKVPSHAVG